MAFWILLLAMQCIEFTIADDLIVPVVVDPDKKKNININLEVNLGIGGNCTAADIVRGNCTNIKNGTTLKPLAFTRLKQSKTTEQRKFEKYGEYVKVKLCSYEFDEARTCQSLCSLLGYVGYACSDLTLCHCWKKSGQPSVRRIEGNPAETGPVQKIAENPADTGQVQKIAENPADTGQVQKIAENPADTVQVQKIAENPAEIGRQTSTTKGQNGIVVWMNPCEGIKDCEHYCSVKHYNMNECTDFETCHCFNSGRKIADSSSAVSSGRAIKMQCTEMKGCAEYCEESNYVNFDCVDNKTCYCSNTNEDPNSSAEEMNVEMSCTNQKDCSEFCSLKGYSSSECRDDEETDSCHCYNQL